MTAPGERPSAPVVEIIEWIDGAVDENSPYAIPVVNDVRINGVSILCSDDPVIVHEISTTPNDVCRVTITVLARRVLIEQRTRQLADAAADLGLTPSQADALSRAYFPATTKEHQ